MGQVIQFPQKVRDDAKRMRATGERKKGEAKPKSAELLFFTGVRYERMTRQRPVAMASRQVYPPFPH